MFLPRFIPRFIFLGFCDLALDRVVSWVSVRVGLVSTVPVVSGLVRLALWVDLI